MLARPDFGMYVSMFLRGLCTHVIPIMYLAPTVRLWVDLFLGMVRDMLNPQAFLESGVRLRPSIVLPLMVWTAADLLC